MSPKIGTFDPEERRKEKARSRADDDRRLRAGEVSRDELRRENGFFSALDVANATLGRKDVRPARQR